MDTQVEKAIDEGLKNFTTKYDLDDTIVDDLRAMLVAAVKIHVKPRPVVSGVKGGVVKRPRRKTGYNLYIRAKFDEAKQNRTDGDDSKTNSQEQMATFSKEWRDLSEDQKQPYIDQAESINAENGAESSGKGKRTGKRNLSGYNLFYREERDNIRESKDKDTALMVAVGAAWKALSEDEQNEYKKRAAELSANREEE
jgi:hypothetical protein